MRNRNAWPFYCAIVVQTFVVLLMIILHNISKAKTGEYSRIKTCIANLNLIERAKGDWITGALDGKTRVWIPILQETKLKEEDLVPNYLLKMPKCPSAGTYTVGRASGERPTCSIPGHKLP